MANLKLHQTLALEKGVKASALNEFNRLHHDSQKANLVTGFSRTYQKVDDADADMPPESTRVQLKVGQDVIPRAAQLLTRWFDLAFTKETGNAGARADLVIDGTTLAHDVPVGFLLFLEKQLTQEWLPFLRKLPTLDPSEVWSFDMEQGLWRTDPVKTNRTKKVYRNHVKAEATEKHPAQVDIYTEDAKVGEWLTTKFSGSIPAEQHRRLIERAEQLVAEIKVSREKANTLDVPDMHIGEAMFGWLTS